MYVMIYAAGGIDETKYETSKKRYKTHIINDDNDAYNYNINV